MNDFEQNLKGVSKAVHYYAHRISRLSSMDYDDAAQELRIVVWKSYTSYDSETGAKFSTFAIRSMINRSKTLLQQYNSTKIKEIATSPELFDLVEDDTSTVEHLVFKKLDKENKVNQLDRIEAILKENKDKSVGDRRAYEMFVAMRREGISLVKYSKRIKINQGWLSRIFNKKIRSLKNRV